jgi:uncharacterized protein YodC (DUF2158 family)
VSVFETGDVVRLNSDVAGKHPMTVESFEDERVTCAWHLRRGNAVTSDFDVVMLTAVSKRRESRPVGRQKGSVAVAAAA